eukprot:Opistho-1_new@17806
MGQILERQRGGARGRVVGQQVQAFAQGLARIGNAAEATQGLAELGQAQGDGGRPLRAPRQLQPAHQPLHGGLELAHAPVGAAQIAGQGDGPALLAALLREFEGAGQRRDGGQEVGAHACQQAAQILQRRRGGRVQARGVGRQPVGPGLLGRDQIAEGIGPAQRHLEEQLPRGIAATLRLVQRSQQGAARGLGLAAIGGDAGGQPLRIGAAQGIVALDEGLQGLLLPGLGLREIQRQQGGLAAHQGHARRALGPRLQLLRQLQGLLGIALAQRPGQRGQFVRRGRLQGLQAGQLGIAHVLCVD